MKRWLLLSIGLVACKETGPDVTANHPALVHAIEAQGFKDVSVDSYGGALPWDGCDENDSVVAHVHATNPFGSRVQLLACSGILFKGVTIRTQ